MSYLDGSPPRMRGCTVPTSILLTWVTLSPAHAWMHAVQDTITLPRACVDAREGA
jgi:hypothetical protein